LGEIAAQISGASAGVPQRSIISSRQRRRLAVDLGAYEAQGFTLTVSSGAVQTTTINSAFPAPLQISVTGKPSALRSS